MEGIVCRRVFRTYYNGHMDKTKEEGGSRGWRWVWLGWGRKRTEGSRELIVWEKV